MEPFIGQIQTFGFNFPPRGWALCNGQLLAISAYQALFSLLGTIYGGDGRTTFGLPDLRGRAALHFGTGPGLTNRPIGQKGGTQTNTLTKNQLPSHTHTATTHCQSGGGDANVAANNIWSKDALTGSATYQTAAPNATMRAGAVTNDNTGGGQSVNNMQPYQVINFSIALVGIYPSRN
jgi:microcystin-dependent protein